jgi:hypothetical protein
MTANGSVGVTELAVDPQHPWLGLFSYTEETRAYFHGRDEEAGELARRVQRKPLTVLFGQSGLGKTSLLRAGLVPRLREQGYCPVYVRIDYAPSSPAPAEQIKQAIFRATKAAGHWTRPGTAIEGETLWEFLHHRGDLLRDAQGTMLMPLLIFDQFEEIFTLGHADDSGRQRAKEFLADLADLVENRAPAALEARLDHDDKAADDFDFARADYRILIALREDYLAHLEGVKAIMPSITQNRMRLARMNGAQALSAVLKPGGSLVSQEIAEAIVRFVGGGSELTNVEIEPSLLSLVCRELNTARVAQGRAEISADLLAGSRDTILSEFYERTLADQPPGVRRVVEDELLTESGHRESLAEERVSKALAAAGAAPDSLARLVDRRLLRIEERLDMRRVELTHDVLCPVVLSSRDLRHEREVRDEAQRQLAAQQAREAAQHRALVRARMVASVCAVLMVLAVASAVFGWVNLRRARVAEAQAQASRHDAEKLVAFLIDDFYAELAPTGKLDTLGRLAHTTVAYYDGLPEELITPQVETFRAMALVREGTALNDRGEVDTAYKLFGEAQAVFERLLAQDHDNEALTYGLALVLFNEGQSFLGGGRGTPAQLGRAADLLRPLAHKPDASRQVRQTYADILNTFSHSQPKDVGVATCEEALKILAGLGALDLSDLNAAAAYADTADSQARHLMSLGRIDEAQKIEHDVYDLTEKVLAQRPGDLRSLADRFFAAGLLSNLADRRHDDATAADYAQRAARAGEDYVRFNPSDRTTWSWWIIGLEQVADLQIERGEVKAALATQRAALDLANDPRRPKNFGPLLTFRALAAANILAQQGEKAEAEKARQTFVRYVAESREELAPEDPRRDLYLNSDQGSRARLELVTGDPQKALADARAVIAQIDGVKIAPNDASAKDARDNLLRGALTTASIGEIRLERYAEAEPLARRLATVPNRSSSTDDPQEQSSRVAALLAHAVAMQGRRDEARTILEPALAYYEGEQKAGAHGTTFRRDYAYALYASALARAADADGRAKRSADLAEADKLLAGASAEVRQLADMRVLAGWIAAARAAPGT